MKTTTGVALAAYMTVVGILNRRPTLPQAGHYRLARLHNALKPEGEAAEAARMRIIMELGHEVKDVDGKLTGRWEIQEKDKNGKDTEAILAYRAQWKEIASQEISVGVEPVSIAIFGDHENGLQAVELAHLGDFITD